MGTLLFQSSKRDEQNKERKMDENNVNGFNDMDDDEDEGTIVLTTPGVSAFSPVQNMLYSLASVIWGWMKRILPGSTSMVRPMTLFSNSDLPTCEDATTTI